MYLLLRLLSCLATYVMFLSTYYQVEGFCCHLLVFTYPRSQSFARYMFYGNFSIDLCLENLFSLSYCLMREVLQFAKI